MRVVFSIILFYLHLFVVFFQVSNHIKAHPKALLQPELLTADEASSMLCLRHHIFLVLS